MYDETLKNYFLVHKDEIIRDMKTLVDIDSSRTETLPGKPFGSGAAACMETAERLMRGYGFDVRSYDNYVVSADYGPENRKLDILAHLDVVPAGNDWTVCEPFCMTEKDGKVYGRGTIDDKGPAMCALYAMRAIKELGIPLKHGVRLILGSDEECGSADLDYYFARETSAPMSFSPDAEFPIIHIEKGGLHSGFTAECGPVYADAGEAGSLPCVTEIHGGTKINIVPNHAACSVRGLSLKTVLEKISAIQPICDAAFAAEAETEDCIRITAEGLSAHASAPEEGKNAVTAILTLLSELPLADTPLHRKIHAVSRMFPYGDYYGKACGVNLEDDKAGKTTLSLNMIDFDGRLFSGKFDLRASMAANDENTTDVIYKKLIEAGLKPDEKRMYAPHVVDENSEIVKGLLAAYEHVTGKKGAPIASGGGTYVHDIENGVAFGCCEDGNDNHMHGADEYMTIEQILRSCEIFAQGILNLCG